MPRIERVLETALYVEDIGRSVDFYQRVLGFSVLLKSGEPERLAAMDVGGVHILLLFKAGATANDVNIPGGEFPASTAAATGTSPFRFPAKDWVPGKTTCRTRNRHRKHRQMGARRAKHLFPRPGRKFAGTRDARRLGHVLNGQSAKKRTPRKLR